uniref:ParB/RepB/Spo0J family partition protein n=1 Tax=candidate division WOR-3 bacterium TaxID=2052148 RepID=A0A7C4YD08_UNCW3
MGKKVLGRGLEALIPQGNETLIPLNKIIHSPLQPRSNIDEESLKELTASIKEKGVLQPVLVRRNGENYELVYGHRRFEAAKRAGLNEIPAIVKELSDREVIEIAIIENIQREDLNPIDEAIAYKKLIEEFGLSHEEIAERVGKNRSTISNKLRLLNLPQKVQDALKNNLITEGHARPLLSMKNEEKILKELENIIKKKEPVRNVEKKTKRIPPEIIEYEEKLFEFLGTKVNLHFSKKKGKIEIFFYSIEDLERIIKKIMEEK